MLNDSDKNTSNQEQHEHQWEERCDYSNRAGLCPCSVPYDNVGMCSPGAQVYNVCKVCGQREAQTV